MKTERKPASAIERSLSQELMESLGLPPQVDVRVAAQAGRMTLLESGEGMGSVMHGDRDLVLSCDVRSFPLADLLSLVHGTPANRDICYSNTTNEEKSGLSEPRGSGFCPVQSLRADRLGEAVLLRAGLIDQDQLELAESRYHPQTRFGKVVVELGCPDAARSLEWRQIPGRGNRSLPIYLYSWMDPFLGR